MTHTLWNLIMKLGRRCTAADAGLQKQMLVCIDLRPAGVNSGNYYATHWSIQVHTLAQKLSKITESNQTKMSVT